jgi:hypothetical protein
MKSNLSQQHPGPQKLVKRSWLSANALRFLAIASATIVLQSFIHKNVNYQDLPLFKFWALELMGLDQSLTIFMAALGTLIVREQYAESVMPYVTYRCFQNFEPLLPLNQRVIHRLKPIEIFNPRGNNISQKNVNELYWNASFRNDGSGQAMIKAISYTFEFTDESVVYSLSSFQDVINILSKKGIIHGVDCWVAYFSSGGAIRPDHDYPLFTAPIPCALKFRIVDIKIVYKNLLGDLFEKNIYCIPRIGIQPYIGI